MRIQASGAIASTPIDTLTEDELKFLDDVAVTDGAPEISGGLMAIATGEDTAHEAQTASSIWRLFDGEALIGFGIRALQGDRHAAEFLIAPDHRGQGLGERLLTTILDEEPDAWCWSHGDHPAAKHLAQKHGLGRDRVLYQMRTDTGLSLDSLPETQAPEGVEIRSFAPGDEDGWLSVNNAAFDWHPEQGGQTRADIDAVVTAADFDPNTFVIAARDEEVIGFHQTKITDTDDEGRLGEVYVVRRRTVRYEPRAKTALSPRAHRASPTACASTSAAHTSGQARLTLTHAAPASSARAMAMRELVRMRVPKRL